MHADIRLVRLSVTARLPCERPLSANMPTGSPRKEYAPFTVLPHTSEEAEALRAWITTHQTMFLVIGAASSALALVEGHIERSEFADASRWLTIARDLRLASAVYTSLPTIGKDIYETYLRPAMMGVRANFSGVSSRESIEFASRLMRLRSIYVEARSASADDSGHLIAMAAALRSDDIWWHLHSSAMRRMVVVPLSLAQREFQRLREGNDLNGSYSDFLAKSLKIPDAMDDYDRFFGCERAILSNDEYMTELRYSLSVSDAYISREKPLATYRAMLDELLPELNKMGQFIVRA